MNATGKQWLDRLRGEEWAQCFGSYSSPDGGRCLVGTLGEMLASNANFASSMEHKSFLAQRIGIELGVLNVVEHWNDCVKLSFPQLARLLELYEDPELAPKLSRIGMMCGPTVQGELLAILEEDAAKQAQVRIQAEFNAIMAETAPAAEELSREPATVPVEVKAA